MASTQDPLIQNLLVRADEDLEREYKPWLNLKEDGDRATLAKELLAIANHGGGYVILGFDDGPPPTPLPAASDYSSYSSDTVNSIIERYADPTFHCLLTLIPHPTTQVFYPVIQVPGNHKVPIRCKRQGPNGKPLANSYYIRRAGAKSETPQTAQEWDTFLRRCVLNNKDEILLALRGIVLGDISTTVPSETAELQLKSWIAECDKSWKEKLSSELPDEPDRFIHGYWTIAYRILGLETPIEMDDLERVLRTPIKGVQNYPGWNFINKRALSNNDTNSTMEFWSFEQGDDWPAAWSYYLRAKNDVSVFLRSGNAEDLSKSFIKTKPGTQLYYSAPVAFLTQSFLHAIHMCRSLNDMNLRILMTVTWNKMANRSLTPFHDERAPMMLFTGQYSTGRDYIESTIGEVTALDAELNIQELVVKAIKPIYRAFNFSPPEHDLRTYVANLRIE